MPQQHRSITVRELIERKDRPTLAEKNYPPATNVWPELYNNLIIRQPRVLPEHGIPLGHIVSYMHQYPTLFTNDNILDFTDRSAHVFNSLHGAISDWAGPLKTTDDLVRWGLAPHDVLIQLFYRKRGGQYQYLKCFMGDWATCGILHAAYLAETKKQKAILPVGPKTMEKRTTAKANVGAQAAQAKLKGRKKSAGAHVRQQRFCFPCRQLRLRKEWVMHAYEGCNRHEHDQDGKVIPEREPSQDPRALPDGSNIHVFQTGGRAHTTNVGRAPVSPASRARGPQRPRGEGRRSQPLLEDVEMEGSEEDEQADDGGGAGRDADYAIDDDAVDDDDNDVHAQLRRANAETEAFRKQLEELLSQQLSQGSNAGASANGVNADAASTDLVETTQLTEKERRRLEKNGKESERRRVAAERKTVDEAAKAAGEAATTATTARSTRAGGSRRRNVAFDKPHVATSIERGPSTVPPRRSGRGASRGRSVTII